MGPHDFGRGSPIAPVTLKVQKAQLFRSEHKPHSGESGAGPAWAPIPKKRLPTLFLSKQQLQCPGNGPFPAQHNAHLWKQVC